MCLTRKKTKLLTPDSQKRQSAHDETSATTHSAPDHAAPKPTNTIKATKSIQTDREKPPKKTSSAASGPIATPQAIVPLGLGASSSEKEKKKESARSLAPGQASAKQGVNFNSTDGSSDADKEKQSVGGPMAVPSVSPVPPRAASNKSKTGKTETTEQTEGTLEEIVAPTKTEDVTKVDFASKDEKPPKAVVKTNSARPKKTPMTKEKVKPSLGSAKNKKVEYKNFESVETIENSKEMKASEALQVDKTQQDTPIASDKKKVKRKYNQQQPSTVLATMTKDKSSHVNHGVKKKCPPKSMDTRKTNTTLLKTDSFHKKPSALNDNVEELSRVPVVRMMNMKAEKFPFKDDNHMDTLEGPTSNFSSSIKPEDSDAIVTTPAPGSKSPMPKSPNKKALEVEKTQMTKTNNSVTNKKRRA
uniref:ENHANCER OF AG-4 protein 2-like n=1 Tax=Panagrellus redivivus TaxID=6233 RepID=A0A7E4ZZD6_PANRE